VCGYCHEPLKESEAVFNTDSCTTKRAKNRGDGWSASEIAMVVIIVGSILLGIVEGMLPDKGGGVEPDFIDRGGQFDDGYR
jgi:hypothetical protein